MNGWGVEDTTEGVTGYKTNNNQAATAALFISTPIEPRFLSISCVCNGSAVRVAYV